MKRIMSRLILFAMVSMLLVLTCSPALAEGSPEIPEQAQKLIDRSEKMAASLLPGCTLCGYSIGYDCEYVDTYYARITEDKYLQIVQIGLDEITGEENSCVSIPVPVSDAFVEIAEQKSLAELIRKEVLSDIFIDLNIALDRSQIPVSGKILNSELQTRCLAMITEENDGRHFVSVTRDENGAYQMERSGVLPETTYMDSFHNSDGELYLGWDYQAQEGAWKLDEDGKWQIALIEFRNGPGYWAPEYGSVWNTLDAETPYFHGTFTVPDLMSGKLTDLPGNKEELMACIDPKGWAVVNNPNPEDRLYLRKRPKTSAEAFGKFWNGTLVRVLDTKGDWCHVSIGTNGVFDGWMKKKYLAFGRDMDLVHNAYPDLMLKEEIFQTSDTHQTWKDPWLTDLTDWELKNGDLYHIIGISEAEGKKPETLIVMTYDGEVGYVPSAWFWEGYG